MKLISFFIFAAMTLQNALAFTMSYEVPVPSELTAFAQYELQGKITVNSNGLRVIEYSLPDVLTGSGYSPIILTEKRIVGDEILFKGELGKANCKEVDANFDCHVEYEDLLIDMAKVESAINQRFTDPLEISSRLEVAKIFSGEPVGILKIKP